MLSKEMSKDDGQKFITQQGMLQEAKQALQLIFSIQTFASNLNRGGRIKDGEKVLLNSPSHRCVLVVIGSSSGSHKTETEIPSFSSDFS
jgi:fatty acid-binding protein DegV